MPKLTKPIALIVLSTLIALSKKPVLAKIGQMDSDGYTVQMPHVNMTSGNKDSDHYSLTDTVGQAFQGQFDSDGFTIKAGFQYVHSLYAFVFTISDITIDFGTLTIGTPSILSNQLSISAPGAGGYQITAFALHPMTLQSGAAQIDDTTCNGGAQTCDENTAALWDNNSTYGFGFNMNSATHPGDIPADFINTSYYRQFADISQSPTPETPQIIMSSNIASRSAQSTVRYKVNISANQAAGDYQTSVIFIASPSY